MKTCMNCQMQSSDDALFCRECGTRFEDTVVEPQQNPEVEAVPEQEAPTQAVEQELDMIEPIENEPVENVEQPFEPVQQEEEAPAPVVVAPVQEPAKPSATTVNAPRDKRQTLGVGAYFWLTLLYCIPIIGLVFMFIWGCGNPRNGSLKRFSLSCLILRIIMWILIVAAAVAAIILFHDKFDGIANVICQFIVDLAAVFGC